MAEGLVNHRIKIKDLQVGQKLDPESRIVIGFLKNVTVKTGGRGEFMLADIGDDTGSIPFRVWTLTPKIKADFLNGSVIEVVYGEVTEYQGKRNLVGESGRALSLPQAIIAGAIPKAEGGKEKWLERWKTLKESLDPLYQDVITAWETSGKKWDTFSEMPAGKSTHHDYLYGLLQHSVQVAELADVMTKLTSTQESRIDRDVVVLGAMLHDIGKIFEYTIGRYGLIEDLNPAFLLSGHLVLGEKSIRQLAKKILSKGETDHLAHIVLSHHEKKEWGAARTPATIEAVVVAKADMAEASLNNIQLTLNAAGPDDWKVWAKMAEGGSMLTKI